MKKKKVTAQGQIKYPKERVLLELYRMRGLTLKQIGAAIFDSYDYAFEYMLNLEKDELVQGKVYNAGKKRLGKLYTITDKGIERLVSANLVTEKTRTLQDEERRLRDLEEERKKREQEERKRKENELLVPIPKIETNVQKEQNTRKPFIITPVLKPETNVLEINEINSKKNPNERYQLSDLVPYEKPRLLRAYANNQGYDKHKVIYTLLTNELYAEITGYGMHFFDAREWKVRHGLNRNAIVRGGFVTLDGEEYSLYPLFSPEQYRTASVSKNMLKRVSKEIGLYQQSRKHIIYVYNEQQYDWVVDRLVRVASREIYTSDVHILRHADGLGYHRIRLLSDLSVLKERLENALSSDKQRVTLTPIPNDDLAVRYADYETEIQGERYYVFNYLTHNMAKFLRLLNEFKPQDSEENGIKLIILGWQYDKERLQQIVHEYKYEHIKAKLLPVDALYDLHYPSKLPLCETDIWKQDAESINSFRKEGDNGLDFGT